MLKKVREEMERATETPPEYYSEDDDSKENIVLPKEKKGFFSKIKFFFANLLTLGIYGRIKRKQLLKKQKEMIEKVQQKGTVEKVPAEELKEEMAAAAEQESSQNSSAQTETKTKTEQPKTADKSGTENESAEAEPEK